MNNVVKIKDWERDKSLRIMKKRTRTRQMKKFGEFIKRAGIFFDKANSERGKRMIKEQEDGNK